MSNACKFSPESQVIEIELRLAYREQDVLEENTEGSQELGVLTTVITDHGKGISAKNQIGLFETFSIMKSGLK